jgi:phosphoglycerate dehydrogenase-like enzyme
MVTGDHLPGFAERRAGHPLFRYARAHDNLVITPHYGGATRDAWERTEQRIIQRMAEACAGRRA